MASWFKAAEDLFEVVDRRAKLAAGENSDEQANSPLPNLFEVVDRRAKLAAGENSDEQANSPLPTSNGQGSQRKRTRLKAKAQQRLSSNEVPKTGDTSVEPNGLETSQSDVAPDKDSTSLSMENDRLSPSNSAARTTNDEKFTVEKDCAVPGALLTEPMLNVEVRHDVAHVEEPVSVPIAEAILSTSNSERITEGSSDVCEGVPTSPISVRGLGVVHEDPPFDSGQNINVGGAGIPTKNNKVESQSASVDAPNDVDMQLKEADLKVGPHSNQKKQQEQKANMSPIKIQDQLDEAQGLLKIANSVGQSKEARLSRICAELKSRVQEFKSENAQLEELLITERELNKSYEIRIKELQKDLFASKSEVSKVESSMTEALAAKNSEIEALVNSMEALKKQAALSEGNLASLQANMESIMRNRELTETRMMQALREEVASAERRAEEEHAAHNATKMAAMEREVELEHRAVGASTALARLQRTVDERTTKVAELEQKVTLLEVECASLNQELQDMETRSRRGQKKSPEEANQMIQMQVWQEEVERARQGQRDAESKFSSMEAEVQKMRVEMAAMKRDAEHYSRQEHLELEKRYRELTDLLYYKQTQLETISSEKAATEFQLEKEIKRLQEAQVEVERTSASRRASSSWEEDTDMKALEPLPLHHRHMAGARIQLQKAAKLLDSGAVRATRFLWRYPTARVLLLFYLVFVHLFLMYLLHRLQEQADSFASREVAESMGLANGTLP